MRFCSESISDTQLTLRRISYPLYACTSALEGGTEVSSSSIPFIINQKKPFISSVQYNLFTVQVEDIVNDTQCRLSRGFASICGGVCKQNMCV